MFTALKKMNTAWKRTQAKKTELTDNGTNNINTDIRVDGAKLVRVYSFK